MGLDLTYATSLLLRYLIGKSRVSSKGPRGHRGPCTCAANLVHDLCHDLSDFINYLNNFLLKTFCYKNNFIVLHIYHPPGGVGGYLGCQVGAK